MLSANFGGTYSHDLALYQCNNAAWILYTTFMAKGELFIFMRKNHMGPGKHF